MNEERMNKLRQALLDYSIEDKLGFDMNSWGTIIVKNNGGISEPAISTHILNRPDVEVCGTACCAAGLYTQRYPEDGLKLSFLLHEDTTEHSVAIDISDVDAIKKFAKSNNDYHYIELTYGPLKSMIAAAAFFEIPIYEASYIFMPSRYNIGYSFRGEVSPEMVIQRIDEVMTRERKYI